MDSGAEVLQGVFVLGAAVEEDVLHVDLYGSTSNICGNVRFTFPEAAERRQMLDLLHRWAADAVPVTFVRTSTSVALQYHGADRDDQVEAAP
jgi:hypothetical protein